ncbi:MAG: serine hydrolase [Candidatus Limnocylindrales bacterium]
MVTSRPRRARVRRALLIGGTAVIVALGSVTLGPVLSMPHQTDSIAVTVTPSPARSTAPSPPVAVASPSPRVSQRPVLPAIPPISPTVTRRDGPRLTTAVRHALQARLDGFRERYGIPGISAAILFPDGTSWMGVSGSADVATGTAVTPSTGFAVASVSKTFTAALILAFVEEGKVGLDAPARTYLPGLTKISTKVTVRQLLDHTSGLRDYFFHPSIDRLLLADRAKRWDRKTTMAYVGKPYFEPGRGWHYSNTNYYVLGLIAEAVGRASLADQLQARFLGPLELDDTWYQPTAPAPTDVAHGYRFASSAKDAPPIDLSDGSTIVPFTSVVTAAGGAGGIAASARDLAHWVQALYGGDVLRPSTLLAMLDVSDAGRYKPSVPYGLGTQVFDIDGRRTYGHSGRLLGFRSATRYLPADGVAIAVLTNQSRTDPAGIVRSLLKLALADPTPSPTPILPVPPIPLD